MDLPVSLLDELNLLTSITVSLLERKNQYLSVALPLSFANVNPSLSGDLSSNLVSAAPLGSAIDGLKASFGQKFLSFIHISDWPVLTIFVAFSTVMTRF